MQAAAVEPRCGVHRHVLIAHREVYHHIVSRQHLVDACHSHALRSASGAAGIEAAGFVVYVIYRLGYVFSVRDPAHVVVVTCGIGQFLV